MISKVFLLARKDILTTDYFSPTSLEKIESHPLVPLAIVCILFGLLFLVIHVALMVTVNNGSRGFAIFWVFATAVYLIGCLPGTHEYLVGNSEQEGADFGLEIIWSVT